MVKLTKEYLGLMAGLILISFFTLLPFYEMVISSIMPGVYQFRFPPPLYPEQITFEYYINLFNPREFPFVRLFSNSLIVASFAAVISTSLGIIGAYSLVRLPVKGKKIISKLIVACYLMGGILIALPIYQIILALKLFDTLYSLLLTYTITTLPLTIFFLANFFRSLPIEIEEAAVIDGCSIPSLLYRVVIPITFPSIVSVFYFAFVTAFNEYLYALLFLNSAENYTLTIGFRMLYTYGEEFSWGLVNAAATLTSVPIILVFSYLEKYLIRGLTMGAIKG
ncbi:MAG: carbohydrate ABC transporter permease [Nitrososphaeria archaeon]